MRKFSVFSLVLATGLAVLLIRSHRTITNTSDTKNGKIIQKEEQKKSTMKITSPAFEHNQEVPSTYTCDGKNINPPLKFSDIPQDAKSLVLIVDDPDAPSKIWVHWVVFNIDPKTTEIAENSIPSASIQGITDFGKSGWGGPCPPSGVHRYFFKLYALDTQLFLDSNADKKAVEHAMQGHILSQAELIGLYKRK